MRITIISRSNNRPSKKPANENKKQIVIYLFRRKTFFALVLINIMRKYNIVSIIISVEQYAFVQIHFRVIEQAKNLIFEILFYR